MPDDKIETPAGDDQSAKPAAEAAAGDKPANGDTGTATGDPGKTNDTGDHADGKPEATDGAKGGDQPAGAPEKYDLKVPDNAAPYIDDASRTMLEAAYRKAGLSNEDAQAELDQFVATMDAQSAAYLAETTADPTYGGDHLAETQRLAKLAIDRIRPADHPRRDGFLRLFAGGFGNNLEVISALADLGKMMSEDTPPAGKASPGPKPERSAADVLFGDTK